MLRLALGLALTLLPTGAVLAQPASGPFVPDGNTLLLYHFDEGQGEVAADASGNGQDGTLLGARWAEGRYGGAVWLNGKDASVFRQLLPAIRARTALTVECWFSQEAASGRRFLAGLDVGFHFEVDEGAYAAMSLYNQGGGVPNAEGRPHHQVGTPIGSLRPRWHHLAACYDGKDVSFFLDGVLKGRVDAADDFALGVDARGLWVGCYVGMDYWFQGRIDEVRVSDCVRYDPDKLLPAGGNAFEMESPETPLPTGRAVRTPKKQGTASLELTIRKLYGTNASGWVSFKAHGRAAAVVGRYELTGLADGDETTLTFDVSDEDVGAGGYLVGLEQSETGAYIALTGVRLARGEATVAEWAGDVRSRRTFSPPLLAPLRVVPGPAPAPEGALVLAPTEADRATGSLAIARDDPAQPPSVYGEGSLEWWLDAPSDGQYDVFLRYAAAGPRPCDIVIDGEDLNEYDMCATNLTPGVGSANALWERQGSVHLAAGTHWIRVQDVLPEIVALRLEPTREAPVTRVPWGRHPVPAETLLAESATWAPASQLGVTDGSEARVADGRLTYRAAFGNTDQAELYAGDCVRFLRSGAWDLEPFGRVRFSWEGEGSGHVVALRLIDAKGDEKLLWRERDTDAAAREVEAPLSFEGNDVFDPGRVVAVCLDIDEGNARPTEHNVVRGALTGLRLERRDELVLPEGYAAALAAARESLSSVTTGPDAADLLAPPARVWTTPVTPETHPLFASTEPRPVTRGTMGYDLHFTGARDISDAALNDFHASYDFGDVCWPHIGICPLRRSFPTDEAYQAALGEFERQLTVVRDRGLYLFDIWGYVPYDEAGPTPVLAPEHKEILLRVFGDRFLGFDNGEQDGRYIGAYADRGPQTTRKEAWEDFVRWDEAICRDSQNYMNATGSLNFSHYYGERGARTLGLETAQGLPSDTLMFAFLRGASKQYGRLTTQATSIWNRFGYNLSHDRKTEGGNGYGFGPNKGCSLSLHKRLMLSSYLGGDSIVGTEAGQFTADRDPDGAPELTRLGRQHLEIRRWVSEHPDRGVMQTPVAFMLDFYSGWNMPRHLYRGDRYKVWGKLPYEKGDYLIDQVFRMVWPGYEDASYLRNERGFVCDTPYGDISDVVTNRCHPEVLRQYTSVMLLGYVEMTPETVANLADFVREGGDLLLDARNARGLPPELTGLAIGEDATGCASRVLASGETHDELPYTYARLTLTGARALVTNEVGDALLAVHEAGRGRVVTCSADYWMTDRLAYAHPELVNMEPPYRLLRGIESVLSSYLAGFSPVRVTPGGLNVRTCRFGDDPGRMLVGLTNNDLFADWTGTVTFRDGVAGQVTELLGGEAIAVGQELRVRVPAGDVAILDVEIE